ncbi:tRNA (cytosine(32)/uridine(32)-2'-O)-methyltransferase TrmJ [Candidatus Enterovibrio altilux]|uniref:tRNA (cytidine/uridine-2'-O-)-methyltransferase TrmJ n=1 Tax=Candidatus Enterovibrio altilux TaxID=1927128 RepID=A0A291BBA2_9GAMM|nr:tRNA (cytosine(32)/uridine(32)-2'-O)-methyltransferase TrmJ [Candidatus Enterovibrio luxaltus]ATF10235.1 tRNA:Cm32/Um32 methyltransferase [Candidatus Enterovibrio luxaltus]
MLKNIRVVLIGTTHSGNIGSAARAMKVMGLQNMVLVATECSMNSQAIALAAGANNIMNHARIVATLAEAVADCGLIIGTSARSRTLEWPVINAHESGIRAIKEASQHPVAFVFGRECTGLTNGELQACHYHAIIPASPEYNSLNLAMAVQIMCYEIRMAWLNTRIYKGEMEEQEYPLSEELEHFYIHLESILTQTNFINKQHSRTIMTKLRRIFNRTRLERQELNILRGVLSSVDNILKIKLK